MSAPAAQYGRVPALLAQHRPRHGEPVFRALVILASLTVLAVIAGLVVVIARESLRGIAYNGPAFLWGTTWDPVHSVFGALPFIYGTILTSVSALVLAMLIGVGVALFLAELAPRWLAGPVGFMVEMLAAIPSVVYGLWGIFVLAPWIRDYVEVPLHDTLGFLPFFTGNPIGIGNLEAVVVLTIMVLPTVAAVSRDVVAAVPLSQREAALALGATRWETIRLGVFPYARSGIIGAGILGLARGIGETMAVTMVIGNAPTISLSLFSQGYTMASVIANEFTEATTDLYRSSLIEIGLLLLIVTLLINAAARLLVWRVAYGASARNVLA
ncbi:MAG: phosphate ABC transporter permease subunit PstC [Chloroflexi bacterium]|nr:phosphate ABC transporter permease subunit PstC [Chloroflexota bacterium]